MSQDESVLDLLRDIKLLLSPQSWIAGTGTNPTPTISRPLYYDRNPKSIFKFDTETPGASTQAQKVGFTYTVPNNRKAFIEGAVAVVRNNSATILNGEASARISVAPVNVDLTLTSSFFDLVRVLIEVGAASISTSGIMSGIAMLQAGESVAGLSNSGNSAVGSNVSMDMYMKATEFDA